MKWLGMSGVGGQKPLIKGPLVGCILLLLLAQPNHCAHHRHHHPTLTVGTVKLRPERDALTPPTVTSFRPPDKGENGKHAVGLTVRGEQSSSNSPPVVASRLPSSATYSAYPRHNIQQGAYYHRPTAPIATAISGSRPYAGLNEDNPLFDRQQRISASKAQSIPALTPRGSRVSAATLTPTSRYQSMHLDAGASVTLSSKRAVPEPMEKSQALNVNPTEAEGGWAEMDTAGKGGVSEGGTDVMGSIWRRRSHNPHSSYSRHDTFGHNITEDLTHLENEYAPRSNQGRGAHQTFSYSPDIEYSAQNSRTLIYPQEEGATGNSNRHNHYQQPSESRETSKNIFGRGTLSRNPTHHVRQPVHRTSGPFHRGYMSKDNSQQRHINHKYDQVGNNSHHDNSSIQNTDRKTTYQNALSTTIIPHRPLSMREVQQLKNISEIGDLLHFLKRKGIAFGQLLEFVKSRATKQEVLDFLDRPDILTTTYKPPVTKSFNESPTNFSFRDEDYEVTALRKKSHLLTKSSETSNIPLLSNTNSDTSFNEGIMHDSTESDTSYSHSTLLFTSPEDGLKDDELTKESQRNGDQEKQRNRKKNRKDRRKNRKNKGNKKKRQRGRKEKTKTHPDFVFTTVILPINKESDVQDVETSETQLPYTPRSSTKEPPVLIVESGISNSSSVTPISRTISFPNQTQVVTLPTERAPVTPSSSTTTLPLIPTTLSDTSTMERNPLTSRSTSSSMPEEPQTDIPTLSPPNKTSEVSIISIAVMKAPINETRKKHGDETVFEYSKPLTKRPKQHKPHQDMYGLHNDSLNPPKVMLETPQHTLAPTPKKTENEIGRRTNLVPEQHTDDYVFPIKGILIISGVMGALAVFTLVVLISYAVIKCSKKPVVNNYQVSEQKPTT
ncbi:uncharacterized protein [Panulirus ornatus]|uniref:uncharacterized protein n=1 Tax=Panulirus ornatus TaxID=150431 RepID=UPI003A8A5CB0